MSRPFSMLVLILSAGSLACSGLPGFLGGPARPAWELPPPPPAEGPIVDAEALVRSRLPNGMEILVLEDHRLPRMSIGFQLRRGAGSVPPDRAGVSAIATEVMQRGAGDRDGLELARVVEDAGASLSVSATWDTTGIGLEGLSEDHALLMEILEDVALRPRFEEGEFRKAVAEHQAGLLAAQDDPATLVQWNALRVLYDGHRYGLPSGGTAETVAKIDVAAARAYWEDRFVPSNTIFWAVGDVDAAALVADVARRFGALDDMAPPPDTPAPPSRTPEARRIVVVDKPELGQARIMIAHEGIARTNPNRIPIDLANDVLGGAGFSSRLMKRVRSDEGLTYGVGSGFSLRGQPGPFYVSTFTSVETTRRVVDLVLEELEALRTENRVSEAELEKFISYNVGRFGLSLETSDAVHASLVDLAVHGLPEDSLDTYRTRLRAVTIEDVWKATLERFHPDRAAIVILGPADQIVPQFDGFDVSGEVEVWQP